jgi:hypothetical protein
MQVVGRAGCTRGVAKDNLRSVVKQGHQLLPLFRAVPATLVIDVLLLETVSPKYSKFELELSR